MSLVAAAVSLLFVLSTVVAVNGWPGIDPDNDVPRIRLSDAFNTTGGASDVQPAAAATPGAVIAAPIVLGASGLGTAATARGQRGDGGRGASTPSGTNPARSAAPSTTPTPAGSTPAPSQPSNGGGGPSNPVAETVRDTGNVVGEAAKPVSPTASSVVTQTTDSVADTVEGTGPRVGEAVPPAAPVVDDVTGRAGEAVRQTGTAVDSVTKGDVNGAVKNVTGAVDSLLGPND
jgi:hypothetical protein